MNGKFIVLEGIDNVGKTTLSTIIAKRINNAVYLKTPIEPFLKKCKEFDSLYHGNKHIEKRFELFVEGMKYSSKIIEEYRKIGKTVIADRWIWTTLAYHFAKDTMLYDAWKNDWQIIEENLSKPDVCYFITVLNTNEWIKRHRQKKLSIGDLQLIEDVKLRHNIIDFFLMLNPEFEIIDNSGKLDNTIERILTSLKMHAII